MAEGWIPKPTPLGQKPGVMLARILAPPNTDLVGLAGLVSGFAYGVVAAFLTSRVPHSPLLLALDYPDHARNNLETVALQFQQSLARAARVEPVGWEPNASGRREIASHEVGSVPGQVIDPL
jgi:hypothetical protein